MSDQQRLDRLRGIVNAIGAIGVNDKSPSDRDRIAYEFRRAQHDYMRALVEISGRGL